MTEEEPAYVPKPHEHLDRMMRKRRVQLRLDWNELARRARISPEALRAIRRGDFRPRDITARRIDEAFEWEPGRTEAYLAGVDTPIVDIEEVAPGPPDLESEPRTLDEMRQRLRELTAIVKELQDKDRERDAQAADAARDQEDRPSL